MARSGCVNKRRRAASPTTMLPSGSRLTTEGQSVLPYGPGIHFGCPVCGSSHATRLLVVPRSIPMMRPISVFSSQSSVLSFQQEKQRSKSKFALQQFLLDVSDQISDVGAAIQQIVQLRHDLLSRGDVALRSGVPFTRGRLQLDVNFAEALLKTFFGGFEARFQRGKIASRGFCFAKLVKRLVELEDFFEQLRWSLLFVFAFLVGAFYSKEIFDARHRMAQNAVSVI